MKTKFYSILLIAFFVFASCEESNPCDEGYTEVNGVCIPDHVVGITKNTVIGKEYYHSEYGVIIFKDNKWHNENNEIIILK